MSNIPGLNFCPDDESGQGIQIPSFGGTITVPESHRFGNCRNVYDFAKLNTISEGTFGVIYKCRDKKTNKFYALKRPKDAMQDGIPSSFLREICLLNTLRHDNIINYYGTIAGKNLDSNYLIMDYYPFSLNYLFEKEVTALYEIDVVKYVMKQVFRGLKYLHAALVIHRNINCENIVFTEAGVLKISGFHASRFHSKGNMTPCVTDLTYRAPELLFQTKVYGSPIDMWSAGCVFARLLLKKPLFSGNSELEVLRSIFSVLGIPSEGIWPGFTEIFAQMEEANRLITEGKPYNELKQLFNEQPLSCQELIKTLLLFYPNGRHSATDCLKSSFLNDLPAACSVEKVSSILKNVLPEEKSANGSN